MKLTRRIPKRVVLAALTCAVMLSGVAATVLLRSAPKAAHAESNTNDVLFIHGFNDNCGVWGDPYSSNSGARPYLNKLGWQGNLKTVGYYSWDTYPNCDVDLNSTDSTTGWADTVNQKCGSYFDGANAYQNGAHGTVDQDLRNLGCRLAWYMYAQYAVNYQNVRVVAHSMGGLIIRYALDRVQNHDSAFPPVLYVPVVITMGTPHGGIADPAGAYFLCTSSGYDQNCLQGSEMQGGSNDTARAPNGNTSSQFLSTLQAESSPPSGGTTYTEWTVIGSECDNLVTPDNATNFPAGPSGSHGTHKLAYFEIPNDAGVTYPTCNSANGWWSYVHTDPVYDYLHDMTTTQFQDAWVYACDACLGQPSPYTPWSSQQTYHSLAEMYERLSLDVPAPPTPTPTPTFTPTPTCATTTETDNHQEGGYTDNRGNTWYVYYDIKRDTPTGLPCQMRVVVRIFNPSPNGTWNGAAAVWAERNGGYLSSSFGKVSGSGTYQYHFVWRGPWFGVSSGNYYIEDTEYNGSNAYRRASGSFSI